MSGTCPSDYQKADHYNYAVIEGSTELCYSNRTVKYWSSAHPSGTTLRLATDTLKVDVLKQHLPTR